MTSEDIGWYNLDGSFTSRADWLRQNAGRPNVEINTGWTKGWTALPQFGMIQAPPSAPSQGNSNSQNQTQSATAVNLQSLLQQWNKLSLSDRYLFMKTLAIYDGTSIVLGTTNGTKLGTTATQKLAVYGATPIVQGGAIPAPAGGGSGVTDAIDISGRAAIVNLIAAIKAFGITA